MYFSSLISGTGGGSGTTFLLLGLGLSSLSESILKAAVQHFEVAHAASSCGLSSLCLDAPVKFPDPSSWVATWSTPLFLDMVSWSTTAHTKGVCFVMALTKTRCSLRLWMKIVIITCLRTVYWRACLKHKMAKWHKTMWDTVNLCNYRELTTFNSVIFRLSWALFSLTRVLFRLTWALCRLTVLKCCQFVFWTPQSEGIQMHNRAKNCLLLRHKQALCFTLTLHVF